MSKVIEFLNSMGGDARLRYADAAQLAAVLERTQIDPAVRDAILGSDQAALAALLGARTNVVCGFAPAQDDDEQEQSPDDGEEIVALQNTVRAA
ncbi:hypothetical protein [Tahibacter caeni]|uniref:hypothetical protein n=1 Tax=Tahibacter caeni TaxID=1453545 RepID=UPI00214866AD|nr:hypothetical protein [Tahibacter caeni]